MTLFKKFAADESGATAIEYGLIAALIAVVIITAVSLLGGRLTNTFQSISNQLPAAAVTTPATPNTGG